MTWNLAPKNPSRLCPARGYSLTLARVEVGDMSYSHWFELSFSPHPAHPTH